ncbi:MAG: hypothetical protein GY816_13645 [Cytophagales bacterium]|nr:hypothetical protein [Cytophagales bacterium]
MNREVPESDYSKYLEASICSYLDPLGKTGQIYQIVNKESGKLIGVENCTLHNGANIRQWESTGEMCQNWLIFPISAKDFVVVNKESGKLMGVKSCSTRNGANVRQWEYVGEACQEWQFNKVGGGYYHLVPRHSNKMIGVEDSSSRNGANIRQWEYTGEECQNWTLRAVGEIDVPNIEVNERMRDSHSFPEYLKLKGKDDVRLKDSHPTLVFEFLVPFFFVNERGVSIQAQVSKSPYYKIRKERKWKLLFYRAHDGTQSFEDEMEYKKVVETSENIRTETTKRFKVTTSLDFILFKLGSEYEHIFKEIKERSFTESNTKKEVRRIHFSEGEPVTEAWWQLIDRYTLIRMDGVEVVSWTADPGEFLYQDTFPW